MLNVNTCVRDIKYNHNRSVMRCESMLNGRPQSHYEFV